MRILLACIHYPVASGRYMQDAFRRLGCDVRTVGYSTGNVVWGMAVDDRYIWRPDGDLTAYWPDWTPDLVVIADSAWAYHSPMYPQVPHVVWGVDNHVRDYRQAGVTRYFLAHRAVSVMDMSAGDTEWLPCAYDPQWHTPSPIPYAERPYDVAMIGVMYQRRADLLTALAKAGLKVAGGTGLPYDQYRALYWNARVSLCVSSAGDVAQRVFETAAMGCAVLTDPLPDLAALDARGIETFENTEEAIVKARRLVDEGEEQVAESLVWAAPHTWDARARRIIDLWREQYAPEPELWVACHES